MKVLLLGANGQLGYELTQVLQVSSSFQLTSYTRAQLDLCDTVKLEHSLNQVEPGIVINAAAYTQVDKAESDEDNERINAKAVGRLAQLCKQKNIPIIHFSTDYVFAGASELASNESDTTNPVNAYGTSKLCGEKLLAAAQPRHLILRISAVFSAHGRNFLKTILKLAANRESLDIVSDQYTCATSY